MTVDKLGEILVNLWTFGGVRVITFQTLLNVVLALAAAIKTDTINFKKLGQFLYKNLLPYIAVYVVAKTVGMEVGYDWLAPSILLVINTTLASAMAENLLALGIPMPETAKTFLQKVLRA